MAVVSIYCERPESRRENFSYSCCGCRPQVCFLYFFTFIFVQPFGSNVLQVLNASETLLVLGLKFEKRCQDQPGVPCKSSFNISVRQTTDTDVLQILLLVRTRLNLFSYLTPNHVEERDLHKNGAQSEKTSKRKRNEKLKEPKKEKKGKKEERTKTKNKKIFRTCKV